MGITNPPSLFGGYSHEDEKSMILAMLIIQRHNQLIISRKEFEEFSTDAFTQFRFEWLDSNRVKLSIERMVAPGSGKLGKSEPIETTIFNRPPHVEEALEFLGPIIAVCEENSATYKLARQIVDILLKGDSGG